MNDRLKLTHRLFPDGIPRLWCPTLTHFAAPGQLDEARLRRHLQVLAPHVPGILVPGSTGEGWEMSDADIQQLLAVVLDAAQAAGIRVLVGVLKTDRSRMLQCLETTVSFLRQRTGAANADEALDRSHVVGFTVCPPKGADLSQAEIADTLTAVLERGLPVALYQLPQVTGNELAPATVAALAAQFPNFYLFKDTSGHDRVASAGLELDGVFLVRGAEGDYARWIRGGGGPYDGWMLSTANVFAPQLNAILEQLADGQTVAAAELTQRVETVVQQTFELVAGFSAGNPFTNANKTLDHVMAYGAAAPRVAPPLLYSGVRLPAPWIERAVELLRQNGFLSAHGYME